MSDTDIPDVDDTDLTRDEMEEVAEELELDTEGLDDQELLERLGVALGEIDGSQVSDGHAATQGDGEGDDDEGDAGRGGSGGGLRATLAEKLEGAAAKLRPSEDAGDGGDGATSGDGDDDASDGDDAASAEADADDSRDGADEDGEDDPTQQDLPGEPIAGPTRDELRDQLRDLGLPVTGTKDELQARLDEAQAEQAETGGDDGGDDPTEQDLPGEPIEGPTRDELRDQLRDLGLPVTGTKDELQARLDEARADDEEQGDPGADDGDSSRMDRLRRKVAHKLAPSSDDDGSEGAEAAAASSDGADRGEDGEDGDEGGARLRDRFADRLDGVADRIRASGDPDGSGSDGGTGSEDDTGSDGPSKLQSGGAAVKRAGAAAKRKVAGGAVKRKLTRG